MEVTLPARDPPAVGERAPVGVWTTLVDPYPGGRFYFSAGYARARYLA